MVRRLTIKSALFVVCIFAACGSKENHTANNDLPDAGKKDAATADLIARDAVTKDAQRACTAGEVVDRVDPARMLADLEVLVGLEERMSAQGQTRSANYVREQLAALDGWVLRDLKYSYEGSTYSNIEATLVGSDDPASYVMAGAHYDSRSDDPADAPGADDNASGVTTVLEIARALTGCKPRHSIRLVFFSNEEVGLIGSTAYVEALKAEVPPDKVIGMLNVDSVGMAEPGEDLDVATRPAYRALADATRASIEAHTDLVVNEIVNDQCG